MRRIVLLTILFSMASLVGCSSRGGSAAGGALGGAAIGVGAYEYSAHRQMQKLDEDYKAGRITKQEYDIRKDQIEKGSILQR